MMFTKASFHIARAHPTVNTVDHERDGLGRSGSGPKMPASDCKYCI